MKTLSVVVVLLMLCASVFAGDAKPPAVKSSPEWDAMKSLVGSWEGTMIEAGQKFPATVRIRLTGDGSALMHILGENTEYEMVSMIHPDNDTILLTHYCAAHNQPRMRSKTGGNAKQIAFEFVDVTNASPGQSYMKRVVITFDGPDRHTEDWTSTEGGKETTGRFEFTRKK